MDTTTTITRFTPGIDRLPGWATLDREKQDRLLRNKSEILEFGRLEGLAALGGCAKLIEAETLLEGTQLDKTTYFNHVFEGNSRTAYRRLADYKELLKRWPNAAERISQIGGTLLKGAAGIQLKSLVTVSKMLPEPKSKDDKVIDAWIEHDVRGAIRKIKRSSASGEPPPLSTSEHQAAAALFLISRMKNSRLRTSKQSMDWLRTVVGWTMEARAIPGTLRVARISIPEGTFPKRGRPRLTPQEVEKRRKERKKS